MGVIINMGNLETEISTEKGSYEHEVNHANQPWREPWIITLPHSTQKKPTLPIAWFWTSPGQWESKFPLFKGINFLNLRCADDTTLVAESKVELKSLLMKVKEESEKAGLKLNI